MPDSDDTDDIRTDPDQLMTLADIEYVCSKCDQPARINDDGKPEHVEVSDAVACSLFYR